jgi:membrane peptidoglycan carboxypeptidase
VRAFIKDGRRTEVAHKVLRQTVSPATAATLTEIMEQVVERGTARAAQIPGYTIAGKTGTAATLINGRYQKSDYNASFVGFIPSRKPAVTILVVIDSPHGNGYTGGAVSAPVFKRIAEATMTYLGVGPNLNAPPPVLVARHDSESSGTITPTAARFDAALKARLKPADDGLMPDLRGLAARDAISMLVRVGMTPRLTGNGFVVEQRPAAGSPLQPGAACVLVLGRRPPAGAEGGAPQ